MPKMLNDDAVEYEDGTPATEAQVTILFFRGYLTYLVVVVVVCVWGGGGEGG
jgi:hypothetical protein